MVNASLASNRHHTTVVSRQVKSMKHICTMQASSRYGWSFAGCLHPGQDQACRLPRHRPGRKTLPFGETEAGISPFYARV